MSKFIVGGMNSDLGTSICEAVCIDPATVRRIVLDLEVGSAGRLYIEKFADDAVLNVTIPAGIKVTEDDA